MDPTSDGSETLDRAECLALLRSEDFGRLALSVGALPSVIPIHYSLGDGMVTLGVPSDPRLASATDDAVVAFQVDHNDPGGVSWTVLVRGRTSARISPTSTEGPASLAPPGHRRAPYHQVRLQIDVVEGLRWAS
jgi:hypothetical protein